MKNNLTTLLILVLLITTNEVSAQITFEKTFDNKEFDQGTSVNQTPDLGYIIGGTDLLKIDKWGELEWTKPYPSVFANLTFDGGYILINNSSPDITFTKVDMNGDTLWQTNNRDGVWANEGFYIQQTNDSGFIVTGRYQSVTGSGMMLLKLNKVGQKVWRNTFSEATSAGFNTGHSVQQTADNGYILTGTSQINYYDSTRNGDVFIVKTDSLGNEEWRKFFGDDEDDAGFRVRQDSDLNYLIAGRKNVIGGGSDMYLIKLDPNGDSLWTKTYGGTFMEAATDLWVNADGGYILSGSSNSSFTNGDFDGYVVRTNKDGDTLWTKNYGEMGPESLNAIQQTDDNGFIIVGFNRPVFTTLDYDMYVLKTNSLGEILEPNSVTENSDELLDMNLYPNPSSGIFNIQLPLGKSTVTILNLLGQRIYSETFNSEQIQIDLSQYPKGAYLYQVVHTDSDAMNTGKVIIR